VLKTLIIATVLLPMLAFAQQSQKRLVSVRLARERQLLHPLRVPSNKTDSQNKVHRTTNCAFDVRVSELQSCRYWRLMTFSKRTEPSDTSGLLRLIEKE
jgi:hypothetical protein